MTGSPWIKFYPADFLNGVADLTAEEIGAYAIVLAMIWDKGGPILDEPQRIARRCGCSTRRWNQLRARLLEEGKIRVAGGRLTNDRAMKELLSREEVAQKRSESSRIRWDKNAEKSLEPLENNESGDANGYSLARARLPEARSQIHSDPDGSAPNGAEPVRNLRQELFAEGALSLQRQTGRTVEKCRSLIGRFLRDAGEDCVLVLAKIRQAEADQVADPAAWIGEAVRAQSPPAAGYSKVKTLQEAMEERLVAERRKRAAT